MKYTFISGATGGIGKAFSKECAKNNENLFLTGRNEQKLSSLKEELNRINNKIDIKYFACNLEKNESREEMFSFIKNCGIFFDKILCIAGVDTQMGILEYKREKLLNQINVNSVATIDIIYSLLKENGTGVKVLILSSMSGVSPMPYFALYSASKSMLTNFSIAMHYELKEKGDYFTAVLPGGVYTREDIIKEIKSQGLWGKLSALKPEIVAKRSLKALNKNKAVYVPGFFNKLLYFIMKITPKSIILNFIKKRWKTHKKDAF